MMLLGIDEAGRGAVIGPLVVAGIWVDERELDMLVKIGVKDSKTVSPHKREEIFKQLKKQSMPFHFFEIFPKRIDRKSINELEIEKTARLINKNETEKVFLDVPAFGTGVERYCEKVKQKLHSQSVEVIGGNKFDVIHTIVAAASIVAKVMRERAIMRLKKRYGDFGSGYPNVRTIAYIQQHYELVEPIVRKKWKTIKIMKMKHEA